MNQHRRAQAQYIIGFAGSVILTLAAYWLVDNQILSGWALAYAVIGLALVQLAVQLVCFLHLSQESEPRWKLLVFDMTLLVVVIVVIGSVWIMNNLHYNTTPADRRQDELQLLRDEGIRRPAP